MQTAFAERKNWAFGKPVAGAIRGPEMTDGNVVYVDETTGLGYCEIMSKGEAVLDLERLIWVDRIVPHLFDKNDRCHYQYNVYVSHDREKWNLVGDRSTGEWRGRDEITLQSPVLCRWLKLEHVYHSEGISLRVIQLEVYGTPQHDWSQMVRWLQHIGAVASILSFLGITAIISSPTPTSVLPAILMAVIAGALFLAIVSMLSALLSAVLGRVAKPTSWVQRLATPREIASSVRLALISLYIAAVAFFFYLLLSVLVAISQSPPALL